MSRRSLVLALLTPALALAGCGELPTPHKGSDASRPYRVLVPPRVVDARDIDGQPAGSPQRVVLEWFGALQRGDTRRAASLFDPALKITPGEVRRQRRAAHNYFRYVGLNQLLDTQRSGDHATVFTILSRAWRAPNKRVNQYDQAQGFDMVRTGGRWWLADDYFLTLTAVPRAFAGS